MVKVRNRVCKSCGKSVPRSTMIGFKFCSEKCFLVGKKKSKCKPMCLLTTLRLREVTFQNGTTHQQQYCLKCQKTKYVSKSSKEPKAWNNKHAEKLILIKESLKIENVFGSSFYSSPKWISLRFKVLRHYGKKCMLCGQIDGSMHVDHIKPRSKYPELEYSFDNLQVLCRDCNLGKGANDETDFRPKVNQV